MSVVIAQMADTFDKLLR